MPNSCKFKENCVYAVKTPIGIKIGFTSRLGDRLVAFQRLYEKPCYPIAIISGLGRKQAMEIEKKMHALLASCAVAAETFAISDRDVIKAFRNTISRETVDLS